MSSSIMRSDCRKFAPNIFNKSKCTNCFRQKEEHSAEALESNRATRKVSKCGYLFVAPGWDFSNPLNRTKRWQRRWFVLYDDGELSYSVDEHPDTVPQASIDMNKVMEVTDAEDVTGNAYSLAVTAADRVHFVKATCREEYRWWLDVLSVFPRSKGRHKRNATFPGVQPISISQQPTLVRATTPSDSRPRFNSCSTEPRKPAPAWSPEQDVTLTPTRDVTPPVEKKIDALYRDQPVSSTSPPTRDKIQSEDKTRTRRVANRERRGVKTGRSFSEDFTGILPSWRDRKSSALESPMETTLNIFDEYDESRREEKLKDIADSLTRPRYRRHTQTKAGAYTVRPTRDVDCVEEQRKVFGRPASPANLRGSDQLDSCDKPVRGDPDGCGLDINTQRYSPSSERRVDLPAEDLLNIKKGWLMKQAPNQEWVKHWFVLRGAALMYYRDLAAEDKGILDGVIDLSAVSSVAEVAVARNYGFQTLLWDERRYVLSAVTASIRTNWMAAIRKEAGLKEPPPPDSPISLLDKKERDLVSSPLSVHCPEREPPIVSSTPLTPRSILFSSDEEYRTASEGGRRESQDWGEPLAPLPPSPPLNRTPISRVKEKARSRTNSKTGVYKRSRSSPPSSRRSTLDSVVTDDLILASCGELPESEADDSLGVDSSKSSLITIESNPSEIVDLKHQLTVALREVSEAEEERLKLRHYRAEVVALENQVKELLNTLEQIQLQLTQKAKEAEEVEALRKRYNDLLREHEGVLSQWRQQTMEDDWKELYKQIQERYRHDSEQWQHKLGSTESALQETTERYESLTKDLASERDSIQRLHSEVISLSERLAQGIEENECLYRRVRELEGRGSRNSLSISREKGRSVDSLSDLTNIDLDLNLDDMDKERITEEYEELRGRFEKAVQEIRAMKRELRESHALFDDLELSCISLRQDARSNENCHAAQSELMVARIDDLTLKLSAAEKQVRTLKQKMAKSDSREKRRSLSLKGRESFQIGKELEEKLGELEVKIKALESGVTVSSSEKPKSPGTSRSDLPKTEEKEKKSKDSLKMSRLRRKSLDSATSSEPMKVLIRLSSLESKVARAAEKAKTGCATEGSKTSPKALPRSKKNLQPVEVNVDRASEERDTMDDLQMLESRDVEEVQQSVQCVVSKLESLLRSKLNELAEKRRSLRESGLLNEEASICLLAEKLAYESVLVSRIAQAIESSEESSESFRKFVVEGEILESSRLIHSLKSKLSGNETDSKPCETATDHLTRILSERLLWHKQLALTVNISETTSKPQPAKVICPEEVQSLLKLQNDLDVSIQDYRKTNLDQVAQALAFETLSLIGDSENQEVGKISRSTLEDRRIREAWMMAQETVNRELIQAEISHVMMRCGQNYETTLTSDQKDNFSLLGTQRMMLEQWADKVEQNLQREMEAGIEVLTVKYETCLVKLKRGKSGPITCSEDAIRSSRMLLSEFADITAQKALIDARISVICQDVPCVSEQQSKSSSKSNISLKHLLETESSMARLSSHESDHLAEAHFQFLFQQFSQQCHSSIMQDVFMKTSSNNEIDIEHIKETMSALSQVEEDLSRLQNFVSKAFSAHFEPLAVITTDINEELSWKSVLSKCSQLCRHISVITDGLLQGIECERCSQLQEVMENLNIEHGEEIERIRECQEQEMASLQADLEKQRKLLTSQHEEEQAQLLERTRRLERRLGTLDSEYMQQVDNLRAAYHKTLSAGLERDVDGEENIRQRYQAEIEQLRALCEKGLAAMESSHRRIISELEEKHRDELEQARLEKDQALAEETQATLAALDAMRKAHEMEVQKEIAKFKTEFVRKMHSAQDISILHKDKEAEMDEIKQEILSLSEKYSVKCVESASYEEQLGVANMKLADAQQHIVQLDARNKQLRAHLVSEASELETADAAQLLRRKSRELEQKCEEMGQLQKKLSLVSNHGEELSALCSRLRDEYLCGERGYADNPVLLAKLWDKVQQLATTWPPQTKGAKISAFNRSRSGGGTTDNFKNKQFNQELAASSAELMRIPLTISSRSNSPFLSSPLRSPSPSPLSGMVAERKKIFEP